MLPGFLLVQPRQGSNGKYNYTVRDNGGGRNCRVLEVQLRDKAFFIKKGAGGQSWTKVSGSPMISWAGYQGSVKGGSLKGVILL